ncbi:hypothetical protein EJB05_30572, partial [Eragrostis curvula]
MVCPVVLAIALDKVDLKKEEHGSVIPIIMLVVAAITLIAGICPFLICRFPSDRTESPRPVTRCLAPLSSAFLVALACWVHFIIFGKWSYPVIGAVFGLCFVIPTARYCYGNDAAAGGIRGHYSTLENSLEFSAGITALLFVGLEGLALEGQINKSDKATQGRLTKPLGASFFACVLGACLMLLETTPLLIKDRDIIKNQVIKVFDFLMTCAICLVMFFIMQELLMKIQALLLFAPPFFVLMVLVYNHAVANNAQNSENYEPAPLELTKVTFTGFLAVSIPSISKDSLNKGTHWFILLAALAIVSGLGWRQLTHYKSDSIKKAANVASFCTHLLIVIAAIPFTVMAGDALS